MDKMVEIMVFIIAYMHSILDGLAGVQTDNQQERPDMVTGWKLFSNYSISLGGF